MQQHSTKGTLSTQRHSGGKLLYHLGIIFTVSVWGASFVSTSVLLQNGLGPVEIYIYRFTLAYLILLLIDHRQMMSNSLRDEFTFMLCGLTSGSIYYIAENSSLEYASASDVSLITALSPLLTAMLIGILYKTERPSLGMWIGSTVAFLGVGCIIFKDDATRTEGMSSVIGDLLALASAMSWAFYSLLLRRISANYSTTFITRKTLFYGVVTSLPFLAFQPDFSPIDTILKPEVMGNLLFLGIVASLICFFLWSVSVKRIGPIASNNYLYFAPVVTMIVAWLVLGDKITALGYIGCALVIGGLILGDYLTDFMERFKQRRPR